MAVGLINLELEKKVEENSIWVRNVFGFPIQFKDKVVEKIIFHKEIINTDEDGYIQFKPKVTGNDVFVKFHINFH